MTRLRWAIADALAAIALRLAPEAAFFPEDEDEQPLGAERWAALIILHAEAIHGCEHTGPARRELGMVGPRGIPA